MAYPPTDDSWTRVGVVFEATEAWEEGAVQEAVILPDGSTYRMWYRGGWDNQAIGYAENTGDPTDIADWVPYASNPVYGLGTGDAAPMALPEVVDVGGTLYMYVVYYPFTYPANGMNVLTSSDGITWTDQYGSISRPAGKNMWGNRVVWKEGADWFMLAEAGPSPWEIYLYTSSDGISWTIGNGGGSLTDLQVASGGMYGGPTFAIVDGTLTPQWDGLYHLWYHAAPGSGNLPTNIYHSTSNDKVNWSTPTLVLEYLGTGDEAEQVADPHVVVDGASAYLFFEGVDNVTEVSVLKVATGAAVSFAPLSFGVEVGLRSNLLFTIGSNVTFSPLPLGIEVGFSSNFRFAYAGARQIMLSGAGLETPEMMPVGSNGQAVIFGSNGPTWQAVPGTTPASSVEHETSFGLTPSVGSNANYARQDHSHGSPSLASVAALGFVGPILISDTPSTPLVFADLLQTEEGDDLLYADIGG